MNNSQLLGLDDNQRIKNLHIYHCYPTTYSGYQ